MYLSVGLLVDLARSLLSWLHQTTSEEEEEEEDGDDDDGEEEEEELV